MIALGFEILAVALAIAYLLLAARESILCWYCAFASSLIFVFLFWDVSLLMESMPEHLLCRDGRGRLEAVEIRGVKQTGNWQSAHCNFGSME